MIGGLWEVPTKSEKVGPNDPQKSKKWVTKIVSGQSALITAIDAKPFSPALEHLEHANPQNSHDAHPNFVHL
jgi:hypothetical protein